MEHQNLSEGKIRLHDKGAVDPMRRELNKYGRNYSYSKEMDEAPMLYIGEKLGTLNGPKFDIAVDPLKERSLRPIMSQMLSQ